MLNADRIILDTACSMLNADRKGNNSPAIVLLCVSVSLWCPPFLIHLTSICFVASIAAARGEEEKRQEEKALHSD